MIRQSYGLTRPRSGWDLFKEFDELFSQLQGNNASATTPAPNESFTPAADIRENEKGYLMAFDLPGIPEQNVKIEVKDGVLSLTGERRRETSDNREGWTRTERSFGRFHRAFSLPNDIDATKIEAQFENGELHLFLPKAEVAKSVQIPVNGKKTDGSAGEVKGLMERFFAPKEKQVQASPSAEAKH